MVFWVLGPNAWAAYLCVARASGVLLACLGAHRHAGMAAKRPLTCAFFPPAATSEERVPLASRKASPELPEARRRTARAA